MVMKEIKDEDRSEPVRVTCFVMPGEAAGIERAVLKLMSVLRERQRRHFIGENNVMRYHHGDSWHRPENNEGSDVKMHRFEAVWEIPYDALVENDLGLIRRSLSQICTSMDRQFATAVYDMVGEAAESVGNVVDAKATGSIAASFLEMLKKIELGVDRDGSVSMPQIHVHPDTWPKVLEDLQRQPPEFNEEVERVKAEKTADALAREEARKAKFKRREE